MRNLSEYVGIGVFGRAYQSMFENDSHAPGSVDCALFDQMIRLCDETADYLYGEYSPLEVKYQPGDRPVLERHVAQACPDRSSDEARIKGVARFCAGLGAEMDPDDLDNMRVGGTEEQIIERGSDWCTDVARVGCAMCQIAGLPARLVMLANIGQAYSGHVIIEVYRGGVWGAVDPTTNVIYHHLDSRASTSSAPRPATTHDLMMQPDLVKAHYRDETTLYTVPGQFREAAVSNYFVWDRGKYDYAASGLNGYYRSILTMSSQGWPGGLRWLHGEDGRA